MTENSNVIPQDPSPANRPLVDPARPPAMPRWVKMLLVVLAVVLVAALVKVLIGGGHGPGMHGSADKAVVWAAALQAV